MNKYIFKNSFQYCCSCLFFLAFSVNGFSNNNSFLSKSLTKNNSELATILLPPDCNNFKTRVIINKLPNCGQSNGSVTIEVTGGTGKISYSWGNSNRMDNLAAMGYWVTVRDESGCSKMVDFELKEQGCESICNLVVIPSVTQPNCEDEGGKICLNVSGNNGPVKYSWEGDNCLSDLKSGIYIVDVSDDVCTVTLSIQLTKPTDFQCNSVCTLEPTVDIKRIPSCGGSNGSVCINAKGAQGPLRFSWGPTGCYDNLVPGRYEVIVSDDVCSKTVSFNLGDTNCNPCNLTASATIHQHPFCMDTKNETGSVSIVATGGTAPYTYSWGPIDRYDNLKPGFYVVTVTDARGCQSAISFNLDDPDCPSMCQLKTTVKYNKLPDCLTSNGSVTLCVAGNDNPITYQWSDGVVTTNPTRNDLTATDYQIVIIEQNSECSDTCHFVISYPPPCPEEECMLSLSVETQNPGCDSTNGFIVLNISGQKGGVTIEWEDGSTNPIQSNLGPGTYSVIVRDDGVPNCADTLDILLVEKDNCCFTEEAELKNPSCDNNDGSVEFNITNPKGIITFKWSDLDTITTPPRRDSMPEGDYEVTIVDDGSQCSLKVNITLVKPKPEDCMEPPCVKPNVSLVTDFLGCKNDTLQLEVTNNNSNDNLDYKWDFRGTLEYDADDISNPMIFSKEEITAVKVGLKVTNKATSCELDTVVQITIRNRPINPPDFRFSPNCASREVSFEKVITNKDEEDLYVWNFGDPNTTDDTSSERNPAYLYPDTGSYSVTLALREDFKCKLDRESLTTTKDVTPNTETLVSDFTYPKLGCDKPKQIQFKIDPLLDESGIVRLKWLLNGDSIGNQNVLDLDVTLIKEDSFNIALQVFSDTCSNTKSERIVFEQIPISESAGIACDEETISLNTFINFSYDSIKWNPHPLLKDLMNPMPKVDTISTFKGRTMIGETCMDVSLTINPETSPKINFNTDNANVCEEGELGTLLVVGVEEDTEIVWASDTTFANPLSEEAILEDTIGTYYVLLDNGCPAIGNADIRERMATVEIPPVDNFCQPSMLSLEAINDNNEGTLVQYEWTPKSPITPPTDTMAIAEVMVSETTTFNVEVTNQFGCKASASQTVMVMDTTQFMGTMAQSSESSLVKGESANLSLNQELEEGYMVIWEDEDGMPIGEGSPITVSPKVTTTYTAKIRFADGSEECGVDRNITIEVGCNPDLIFFPNAFSPNGDQRNDTLLVRGAEGYLSMRLIIFNRWGQKVFESDKIEDGWDGYFNNEKVCADVYGYYLRVTCPSGVFERKRNITVLK